MDTTSLGIHIPDADPRGSGPGLIPQLRKVTGEIDTLLAARPAGTGTANKLTFWPTSTTLDDTTIAYSSGKLGFGGVTSPAAWLDVSPATNEKVFRASLASGTLIGVSLLHTFDPLSGPFQWIVESGNNPSGTRKDTAMEIGYNPLQVADQIKNVYKIENWYDPGGPEPKMETYFEFKSPLHPAGAVSVRYLSWDIHHDVKNIQATLVQSRLKIFDWPNHEPTTTDHPYLEGIYPDLYVHDGYVLIDNDQRAGAFEKRGVRIGGRNAIEFDFSNTRYYIGDNTGSPTLSFWGSALIGGSGDDPVASRQLWLKTRDTAIDDMLWLLNAHTADNYIGFQSPDGTIHGRITTGGQIQFGLGTSGSGPDVGLMRSASATWKVTDAGSGYGSMDMANLLLANGGVINFNGGDVTITHSANALAFAGASSGYTFDTPIGVASGGTGLATLTANQIYKGNGASPIATSLIFDTGTAVLLNATTAYGRLAQMFEINVSANYGGMCINTWSTDQLESPFFEFNKSKSASIGTQTSVVNGDYLGILNFRGSANGSFQSGGGIIIRVNGTVSGSVMPTEIVFRNNDSGGTQNENLIIKPDRTLRMLGYGAGTATFDASGNISSVSDIALKDEVGNFGYGLEALRSIKPILYKWLPESGMETEHTYPGFSAQNVLASIPEAVGRTPGGRYTLQDRGLIAALVNAVKELDSQLRELKGKLYERK